MMNSNQLKLIEQINHRITGSALVESFLIVGVMVLFMIGLPIIGKAIDLKQTTVQASRYSAWEKTVENTMNPDSDINQVDTRFFMDAAAPIQSGGSDMGTNHLWGAQVASSEAGTVPGEETDGGTAGPGTKLSDKARVTLVDGSVETDSYASAEDGYVFGSLGSGVAKVGAFVSSDGWDENNPVRKGIVMSNVKANVKANALFSFTAGGNCSGGEGCVSETTAILVDGWSAGDPAVIRDRVHGFVPTARLHKLGRLISKVSAIPMLGDLKGLKNAFGCVKTNIVPGTKDFAPDGRSNLAPYVPLENEDC